MDTYRQIARYMWNYTYIYMPVSSQMHHEFTAPIALVAIYCTPIEFVLADLIPLSAGFIPFRSHVFFAISWIVAAVIGTQVHTPDIQKIYLYF